MVELLFYTFASVGHAHRKSPLKGFTTSIAVIDITKDVGYVQMSPLEIILKVSLTEVTVLSKSDVFPFVTSRIFF